MSSKRKRPSLAASSPIKPTKKPRTEPTHDPLWTSLISLPPSTRDFLLYDACKLHPSIALSLHQAQQEIVTAHATALRRAPVVDFDDVSKDCWHLMTNRHPKKSASKIKWSVERICGELEGMRRGVLERAGEGSRFESRRNAVEGLRRVCKSLVLCGEGVFGREVVVGGGGKTLLEVFLGSLLGLVKGMDAGERERFVDEGWWEKLGGLRETFADEGFVVKELDVVYELLGGLGEEAKETEKSEKESRAKEEDKKKEDLRRIALQKKERDKLEREREFNASEQQQQGGLRSMATQKKDKLKKQKVLISIDLDDDVQIVDSW